MTTLRPMVVKCPYCGKKRSYMWTGSCYCGERVLWSDSFSWWRFWGFEPSGFLCRKCKNIYLDSWNTVDIWFLKELFLRVKFSRSWPSKDFLSYLELKQHKDSLDKIKEISWEQAFELWLYFLHKYNTYFFRFSNKKFCKFTGWGFKKDIETDEDKNFKKEILNYILDVIPDDKIILEWEILRELWKFDECIELLEYRKNVINQIVEHAKNEDRQVFIFK